MAAQLEATKNGSPAEGQGFFDRAASFWAVWALVPILILVLYLPLVSDLVNDWETDPDNAHGFLVPLMVAWLVWRKRRELAATPVRVCWIGLPGMVVSLGLYFVCYLGAVAVGARLSFVLLLYFSVLFTLGKEFERKLRFPLLFLVFMVPVPSSLKSMVAFPLQLFASKVSAVVLDLLGIVVVRDGNVLHLRETSLEVAAACSGIRSMVSYLMLGVFFSYVSGNRKRVTALLIGLSIPIALTANIARVVLSGVLAEWFGPETAEGFLHEASGLIMFGAGFFIFLGLNRFLNRFWPSKPRPAGSDSPGSGGKTGGGRFPPRRWMAPVVAVILLLAANAQLIASSRGTRVAIVEPRLEDIPYQIGDWMGRPAHFVQEKQINDILGVDISFLRIYQRGDDQVELYVGYYGTEKGGRSSHNPESCYVGAGWSIGERDVVEILPDGSDRPVAVNHMVVGSGDLRQELLHWYQVAGKKVVHRGIDLNLLRFWRRVTENRNDGAFVRVTSYIDPSDPGRAFELVKEFSAEILPLFPRYWPVEEEVQSSTATSGGQASR